MKKNLYLVLIAVLTGAAGTARADTALVSFTALPYTDLSGGYGSAGATYNGYVTATVNGIPLQMLICDDYLDETLVPSGPLIFDESMIGSLSSPADLHFGDVRKAQTLYDEAAVLNYELFTIGPHAAPATVTDYQYAIWNLFDPAVNLNSSQQNLQTGALSTVSSGASWLSGIYSSTVVYTPDPKTNSWGNQEFLEYQGQGTPEPATYLLVGAVLMGLGATRRRRQS